MKMRGRHEALVRRRWLVAREWGFAVALVAVMPSAGGAVMLLIWRVVAGSAVVSRPGFAQWAWAVVVGLVVTLAAAGVAVVASTPRKEHLS